MSAAPERPTTAHWQDLDRRHHIHPFTDSKALHAKGSAIMTRADGVYIWDTDGKRYLDGMAGLWCVNVGYGRGELAEAAHRQLLELPYYNSFFQSAHPPAVALSARLAELAPPNFNRVFFTNSGSEANDTVVRIVRHYWASRGKPDKNVVISRDYAYHGSTVAGASMSGNKSMHQQGNLPIADIEHIPAPYWYAHGGDDDPEAFGRRMALALEEKIQALGEERVAAFIAEPVQGAGGLVVPPASYWPEIQRICDQYEILLVSDEVICGFGRLGQWFGCQHYGVRPDLMAIAKGLSSGYLPIGGVMVSDAIAEVLIDGGAFYHGFTYSGHPAACAVALANLDILAGEQLIERTREDTGPYLQSRWQTLADHPLVGEARGQGLLAAVELTPDKARRAPFDPVGSVAPRVRQLCLEHGLITRALRDVVIVCPPLTITRAQIDDLVDTLARCLDLTAQSSATAAA